MPCNRFCSLGMWAQMLLQVVKGINYDIITPECMEGFCHETWFDVKPGESTQKALKICSLDLDWQCHVSSAPSCVQPRGYWPCLAEAAQWDVIKVCIVLLQAACQAGISLSLV